MTVFHVIFSIRYMKSEPIPTATAINVRRFRERMREQGLLKKEIWIRPEYAAQLALMEKGMREPNWGSPAAHETGRAAWTLASLESALRNSQVVELGHMQLDHLEGVEPSLRLTMLDKGNLEILLAVHGEQVLVESVLWPASSVVDVAAFNDLVLQTHKYLPLSTVSIEEMGGEKVYTLFGALDTQASLSRVLFEIQTLAENVLIAAEMYASHLTSEAV